jgi:hypothetical protein
MLGWIYEKMDTQESTLGGGRFSTFSPTGSCVAGGDCSTTTGNDYWDNAHTFDPSSKGERLVKSQVLWCNMHNVQVGVQMVKLAAVQLV